MKELAKDKLITMILLLGFVKKIQWCLYYVPIQKLLISIIEELVKTNSHNYLITRVCQKDTIVPVMFLFKYC